MFDEAANDTAINGRYVSVASFRIGLLHHCRQFGESLKDVYIDKRGVGNEAIDFPESALSLEGNHALQCFHQAVSQRPGIGPTARLMKQAVKLSTGSARSS